MTSSSARQGRPGRGPATAIAAIAAGSAAAVYAERDTIASGLAARNPSQAHNRVIGTPPATRLARTSRAESAFRSHVRFRSHYGR